MSDVIVAGVGMIPFAKPGASAPYHEMGTEAARLALADAGLGYETVQQPMSDTSTAIPPAGSARSTMSE